MTESHAGHDLAPDIMAEHRQILRVLATLADMPPLETLRAGLAELRGLLEAHFAREEGATGLSDVLEANAPRLLGRLQPIFDQHVTIIGTVRELERRATAGENEDLAVLQRQVSALIGEIQDHERRENDLLQDALVDDIGAND